MSTVVVVPVLLPVAAPVAWPLLAVAAGAAALGLGYAALNTTEADLVAAKQSIDVDVPHVDEIAGGLALGSELAFQKDDVVVTFHRDAKGHMGVRVHGENKSDEELAEIGRQMAEGLVQQYAYHRIVSEMKERGMNVVEEEVEADGTVRLQVRVFQG